VYRDSVTGCVVKIKNKPLKYGTDFYTLAFNNEAKETSAGKIVFAGYGISEENYDDYKSLDVKGKVVVMFLGEPVNSEGKYIVSGSEKYSKYTYPGIRIKVALAKKNGAAAVIFINPSMEIIDSASAKIISTPDLYFPRAGAGDAPNYIIISHKTAKKIFAKWKPGNLIKSAKSKEPFTTAGMPEMNIAFRMDYKKEKQQVNASNVLGIIQGSEKKDEYVFLTAHYDHLGKKGDKIYYGADDDGSGTCAVLQMAEAFAKAKAEGKGPKRTIVFMTVSGEEKGLWGSEYYTDHPVFPLDKTSVDLNTDMVGRIDTERKTADSLNYVYVIGHDKLSTDLPVINEAANNKYTHLVLDYKFDDPADPERIYFRSDHYNFARKAYDFLYCMGNSQ
jgi:Zn-dependent M28 family amino/carboxypeptidase